MLPNIKTDHNLHASSSQDTKRLDNLEKDSAITLMQSPEKVTPLKIHHPKQNAAQDNDIMKP